MDEQAIQAILKDTPDETCECGCKNFTEVVRIRRMKGLLIGSPTDAVVPLKIYVCASCGKEFQFK